MVWKWMCIQWINPVFHPLWHYTDNSSIMDFSLLYFFAPANSKDMLQIFTIHHPKIGETVKKTEFSKVISLQRTIRQYNFMQTSLYLIDLTPINSSELFKLFSQEDKRDKMVNSKDKERQTIERKLIYMESIICWYLPNYGSISAKFYKPTQKVPDGCLNIWSQFAFATLLREKYVPMKLTIAKELANWM